VVSHRPSMFTNIPSASPYRNFVWHRFTLFEQLILNLFTYSVQESVQPSSSTHPTHNQHDTCNYQSQLQNVNCLSLRTRWPSDVLLTTQSSMQRWIQQKERTTTRQAMMTVTAAEGVDANLLSLPQTSLMEAHNSSR